jgi:hypothetical protein
VPSWRSVEGRSSSECFFFMAVRVELVNNHPYSRRVVNSICELICAPSCVFCGHNLGHSVRRCHPGARTPAPRALDALGRAFGLGAEPLRRDPATPGGPMVPCTTGPPACGVTGTSSPNPPSGAVGAPQVRRSAALLWGWLPLICGPALGAPAGTRLDAACPHTGAVPAAGATGDDAQSG